MKVRLTAANSSRGRISICWRRCGRAHYWRRLAQPRRRSGESFLWDGVQVKVLWPEIAPQEVAPLAKNNDSLVIRLQYGDRSILLPGDAEKQVEYTMLGESEAAFLHADVLKVGHHGGKNSTMPEFLS
jgi:competence protein ComEC